MTAAAAPARPPTGRDARPFREFAGRWPTGVTVVTAATAGGPVGCTVSTLLVVPVDPPLVGVVLARSSRTLPAVRDAGRLGVNVLASDQRWLIERFAGRSGGDRFGGVRYAVRAGVPVLDGAAGWVSCALDGVLPVGDHVLLVGRPLEWTTDAGRTPLVLLGRRSYRLRGAAG